MVQGNQGISPQNMIGYGTVPTFLDPEILADLGPWCLGASHIFPNDASDDPGHLSARPAGNAPTARSNAPAGYLIGKINMFLQDIVIFCQKIAKKHRMLDVGYSFFEGAHPLVVKPFSEPVTLCKAIKNLPAPALLGRRT